MLRGQLRRSQSATINKWEVNTRLDKCMIHLHWGEAPFYSHKGTITFYKLAPVKPLHSRHIPCILVIKRVTFLDIPDIPAICALIGYRDLCPPVGHVALSLSASPFVPQLQLLGPPLASGIQSTTAFWLQLRLARRFRPELGPRGLWPLLC